MNGGAESLGQILQRMTNSLLKDSGFAILYWLEHILIANYF